MRGGRQPIIGNKLLEAGCPGSICKPVSIELGIEAGIDRWIAADLNRQHGRIQGDDADGRVTILNTNTAIATDAAISKPAKTAWAALCAYHTRCDRAATELDAAARATA